MDPRVAKFFDRYAADFDSIYGNSGGLANDIANKLFRRSMKLRFVKTLEGCQPVGGKDVLDIEELRKIKRQLAEGQHDQG